MQLRQQPKRKQEIRYKRLKQSRIRRALEKFDAIQEYTKKRQIVEDGIMNTGGTMLEHIKDNKSFSGFERDCPHTIKLYNLLLSKEIGKKPLKRNEVQAFYEKIAENYQKSYNKKEI